jgi:hypothetical protein
LSSRESAAADPAKRSTGLLRVPFVQRCEIEFDDGTRDHALVVNINVLGAYVARDEAPRLGQPLRLRFGVPGRMGVVEARGAVAWVNQHQEHPVHSLPPGFGVRFSGREDEARRRIESIVSEYVRRHGLK